MAAAAAANKTKKLPKELQDYKKEIKALPFKDRVKALFNCSPFLRDIDSQKKEILLKSFNKEERVEFERLYRPIYSAIERYGDRMRAIYKNLSLYNFIVGTILRHTSTMRYTADFLNRVLPKVEEALESTKEDKTRETLAEAYDKLKGYREVQFVVPFSIGMNEERTEYKIDTTKADTNIREFMVVVKGLLSLLKCYLEALREFLEWVGTPELYPKEFDDMEYMLKLTFKPIEKQSKENPNAKEFPLWSARNEVEEEYFSIDYDALPRSVDIFGENNLFANTYRSFFNY